MHKKKIYISDKYKYAFGYDKGKVFASDIRFRNTLQTGREFIFYLEGCEIDKSFIDGMFHDLHDMDISILNQITFSPLTKHEIIMDIVRPKFKKSFWSSVTKVIIFPYKALFHKREKTKDKTIQKYETALEQKIKRRNELLTEVSESVSKIEYLNNKFKNNIITKITNKLHDIINIYKEDDELNISSLKNITLIYTEPILNLLNKIYNEVDNTILEKEYTRLENELISSEKKDNINKYDEENTELKQWLSTIDNQSSDSFDILLYLNNKQSIYNEINSINVNYKNIDAEINYLRVADYLFIDSQLTITKEMKYLKTINNGSEFIIIFSNENKYIGVKYPFTEIFTKGVKVFNIDREHEVIKIINTEINKNNKTILIKKEIDNIQYKINSAYTLNDEVITTLNIVNDKLLTINIKGNENSYDIELRQLKDLINSGIV